MFKCYFTRSTQVAFVVTHLAERQNVMSIVLGLE